MKYVHDISLVVHHDELERRRFIIWWHALTVIVARSVALTFPGWEFSIESAMVVSDMA